MNTEFSKLLAGGPEQREKALAHLAKHKHPTYGSDPNDPRAIIQFLPDGTKRRGRFVNRCFVADTTQK